MVPDRALRYFSFAMIGIGLALFWNRWYVEIIPAFLSNEPARDFYVYYAAGRTANEGDNPYLATETMLTAEVHNRHDGYSMYLYPPTFLPLYRFLGLWHWRTAQFIWTAFYLLV